MQPSHMCHQLQLKHSQVVIMGLSSIKVSSPSPGALHLLPRLP